MNTLTTTELKERLQQLAPQEYALPKDESEQALLVSAMLAEIGNTDSELRDDLIYMTLGTWCYDRLLPPDRRRTMLQTLLDDNHLFYRIGEQGTDSVFTRSFSVLLVAAILAGHVQDPFLEPGLVALVKEKLLAYVRQETDRRGYVPGPGWAHSAAHTADALGALALSPEVNGEVLSQILDAILLLAAAAEQSYAYNEDGRLAAATVQVLERRLLPPETWKAWLQRFPEVVHAADRFPANFRRRLNVRHFLMSLYFALRQPEVAEGQAQALLRPLTETIESVLQEIAR